MSSRRAGSPRPHQHRAAPPSWRRRRRALLPPRRFPRTTAALRRARSGLSAAALRHLRSHRDAAALLRRRSRLNAAALLCLRLRLDAAGRPRLRSRVAAAGLPPRVRCSLGSHVARVAPRRILRALLPLGALLVALWLALFGAWLPGEMPGPSPRAAAQAAPGRILAVVGRQVGWLNLDAPRPQVLTAFQAPSFAMDVAAIPTSSLAAVAVAEPLAGQVEPGGDLLGLDLSSSSSSPQPAPVPLVLRADAGEWLGAPMWLPDGSALVFQREDLRAGSDLYAGQAAVRYPACIELAAPGGTRSVLVADGHHPSPSPDGSELAFVRLSPRGTALLVHSLVDGTERVLVPPGALPDITYPRYAPSGDRLAFMATTASSQRSIEGASPSPIDLADLLGPPLALAHGLPWNLWTVGRDGAGLHQLAPVGADDASVAWSPDGSQLFVYGSTGARLVDATTGETQLLTFLAGFGAIAWLP